MKTRGRAICAARRIHSMGPKKAIQTKNYVSSAMVRASRTYQGPPWNPCRCEGRDAIACDFSPAAHGEGRTGAASAVWMIGLPQSG